MDLTNYQDVSKVGASVNAGFQFEFRCGNCSRTWKSPYKPYRRGQLSGLLYKVGYFIRGFSMVSRASSAISDTGEKHARQVALKEAIVLAEQRYSLCPGCKGAVCEDCW